MSDNDTLRRISSAEAAMFTIRRVRADSYALMCSGWPTPMPLPEWHVPSIRASLLRGNVQNERKNAQVFCGSTQKTRTDHEKLKFAKSKGSSSPGTIPVKFVVAK